MSLDKYVRKFAESVIGQEKAQKAGDWQTGNEFAKAYVAVFNDLRSHGDEGREALTSLFAHESDAVRSMAAAFLLRYCEDRARVVLEEVAKRGQPMVAFTAKQTLQRWEEGGTWNLDPE